MCNPEGVTLAAFKDYIDALIKEGNYEAEAGATAFINGLEAEEIFEAIKYVAENNIELRLVPDSEKTDPEPLPDEAERRQFNYDALDAVVSFNKYHS